MKRNLPYTLLYDASCRMCAGQVGVVEAYDQAGRIELLDINSEEARMRFPQITPQDARRELHLAAPDGTISRGAEAVRQTLLLLPLLRGLGRLMSLPGAMVLARPLYAWVARNRYRLGGKTGPCDAGTCGIGPNDHQTRLD
ncbi:MAG: DUF393 domain-containing protein [Chloroflexaceae bacterium]|nr:DUF393 domain-containing protein [Chloroflexaceae bacterium]